MPTYFLFRSLTSCTSVFEITDAVKPSEEVAGVHMDGTVSLRASLLMLSRPLKGSKPGPFFLKSSGGSDSFQGALTPIAALSQLQSCFADSQGLITV